MKMLMIKKWNGVRSSYPSFLRCVCHFKLLVWTKASLLDQKRIHFRQCGVFSTKLLFDKTPTPGIWDWALTNTQSCFQILSFPSLQAFKTNKQTLYVLAFLFPRCPVQYFSGTSFNLCTFSLFKVFSNSKNMLSTRSLGNCSQSLLALPSRDLKRFVPENFCQEGSMQVINDILQEFSKLAILQKKRRLES